MADNDFRPYRGRDAGAPTSAQADDPLAELARLIGQTDPARDPRRNASQQFEEPTLDWPAQEGQEGDAARYTDEDRYAVQAGAEDYDAAYDDRYDPPPEDQYAPDDHGIVAPQDGGEVSALSTRLNGTRDFARDYYVPPEQSRFRETPPPRAALERQPAAPRPEPRVERYQFEEDEADDQAYEVGEYQDEEAPAGRRRGGLFVVAAVLGLAILGTAGAFAYRAMFGSSVLPSLPPIIKADDGPNKIIPAKPKNGSDQAAATDTGSGEKLVSREEQPVDMPAPVNPASRAVSTIPIFPDPNSAQAGMPNSTQPGMGAGTPVSNAAPVPTPPPVAASAPPATANSIWPPAPVQAGATAPAAAPAAPAPGAASTTPHKVHTVVIRADQSGAQLGSAMPEAAAATPPPAAEPAPVRAAPARVAAAPPAARPAPAPRVDANAPLSIIPDQGGGAPPPSAAPRMRTAMTHPAEAAAMRAEPAAPAGGGYAVQVTSQRSEADAQAEFRALKAKFPSQLGGHQPLIRRADLGAKGVYYRALVGPFASAEQAAAMCSGLKAAGGTCIVQRN